MDGGGKNHCPRRRARRSDRTPPPPSWHPAPSASARRSQMSVIDDIKARLDIVDVIGGYVPLQKAGRSFKAPCPFHTEKTPSFIVNPDRQTWHCFGACGTGGDIIGFITRKENLDFAGALRFLAERAGIELHSNGPRREELKTLFDVNEAAALYYHGLLLNEDTPARNYADERGLD